MRTKQARQQAGGARKRETLRCDVCGTPQVVAHMTMTTTYPERETDMPPLDLCSVHFAQIGGCVMEMLRDPLKFLRGKPSDLLPGLPDRWEDLGKGKHDGLS